MNRVRIAYGGVEYLDRALALQTGAVSPAGIDLNYVVVPGIGDLFRRVAQFAEFDAAEMSACSYFMMLARGDRRFTAIPVFPSRSFRHSQVYVNSNAGIKRPEDLAGRDIGILDYQMTAALWIRGFLQHDYGVSPAKVRWWTGGLYTPDFAERMPMKLLPDIHHKRIPEHETLEGMLSAGKLAALVTVEPPRAFLAGSPDVQRLFPNYREIELEYFRRTGFFPIMHLVVIRRDVYEKNRWIAVSMVEAFERAKEVGRARMNYQGAYAVSLPWLNAEMEVVDRLFSGDAFPYGVTKNRKILEQMVVYAREQGLTERRLEVDELFAPETYQDSVPG
jgi:4,5-dihydroxyphthalate decarboxylase